MDETDWTPSAANAGRQQGPSMLGSMIGNSLPMLLGTYLSQTLPIEDPTARTLIAFQSGQMLGNIARVAADKIRVPEFVHRWWNPLPQCRMPYRVRVASDSPMFDKLEQHVLGLHVEKLRRCDLRARSGMIELTLTHATFTQPVVERWTDTKTNQCHEIGLRILSSSQLQKKKDDPEEESELMKCDRLEFDALSRETQQSNETSSGQKGNARSNSFSVPRLMGGCDGDILVSSVTANCSVLREYVMHVYQLRETSELRAMTIFVTRSSGTTSDHKNKKKEDGHAPNKRAKANKIGNEDDGTNDGKNARSIEWEKIKVITNRCLDNTMTSDTVDQELVRDVKRFMESEEWYNRRGLTYKRGYLLHGPPGTGKTSLVKAISTQYKLSVFVLDLNQVETNEELMRLTTEISYHLAQNERYILLLEDVDRCRVFAKYRTDPEKKKTDGDEDMYRYGRRSAEKRKKKGDGDDDMEPTMDCLLNVFDGIIETQGRLLFLTGNDTSPLHAVPNGALLRPGRIDRQVHVPHCTDLQMRKILSLFYEVPDSADALADLPPLKENAQLSAAMLTLVCQNYADDLEQAIAHVKSLYCNDPNAPPTTEAIPDAEALELEKRLKHTGEEKFGFGASRAMMARRTRRMRERQGTKWEKQARRMQRDLKDMEKLKTQIAKVQDRLSKSVEVPSLETLEKEELLARLRKIESEVSSSASSKKAKKEPPKKRAPRKPTVKKEKEEKVPVEVGAVTESAEPRANTRYSLRPGKMMTTTTKITNVNNDDDSEREFEFVFTDSGDVNDNNTTEESEK